jgi:23S rRNA (cytosine1962-C5)-methyltransferase
MTKPHLPIYQLHDFGNGRKLETFCNWLLDRPAPGAEGPVKHAELWKKAKAKYDGSRSAEGDWKPALNTWENLEVGFIAFISEELHFELKVSPLPSGQVGVFPEQLESWVWIAKQCAKFAKPQAAVKVLNLFAYTEAEVTHVDAAKSMVARARENAVASGLADAPIRWIVEDAVKFCQREVKRGNQYDAVILDPPTYGHGPKGEAWSIKRDLLPLLELCRELTAGRLKFALCTCHTPGVGQAELSAYLSEGLFGHCGQPPKVGPLNLETADGRKLESGTFARWPR